MITGEPVWCPSRHLMVEIAPGLYQCPFCGWGPSQDGHRRYAAFYDINCDGNLITATFVEWCVFVRKFRIEDVRWEIDRSGMPVPLGLVHEEHLGWATEDEGPSLPCPAVSDINKWGKLPNMPKLLPLMWLNPLGPKFLPSDHGERQG